MDLKGPVESGKSQNSSWTGTTARGSATWTMGLTLRNLVLPGADVVHLSEKGKCVFSHSFNKPGKRALNQQCWGWGTSIYPTDTSLMSVPAKEAQSLEQDHKSVGQHLKGTTRLFQPLQPLSWLHGGPNWNASVQTQATWGINKKSLLWSYWHHADVVG